jgi:hypothetical protein
MRPGRCGNAGTGALACSAFAMLDLPALVVPCRTIAVGVIAPNMMRAPIIREQIVVVPPVEPNERTKPTEWLPHQR